MREESEQVFPGARLQLLGSSNGQNPLQKHTGVSTCAIQGLHYAGLHVPRQRTPIHSECARLCTARCMPAHAASLVTDYMRSIQPGAHTRRTLFNTALRSKNHFTPSGSVALNTSCARWLAEQTQTEPHSGGVTKTQTGSALSRDRLMSNG
jgi:hypothetical protein